MTVTGAAVVAEVKKFVGDPYVYGAAGPNSFDCSGLVQYSLTQLGFKNVPRTSEAQYAWVQHIGKNQLQPGDLVFGQFPGDNQSPGHVGIYIGGGQVLNAADPQQGVVIGPLSDWGNAVVGYGRIPGTPASKDTSNAGGSASSGAAGLWPSQVTGFFTDADSALGGLYNALVGFLQPSTWVRAGAGIAGFCLLAGGLWYLIKAAALWPGRCCPMLR